MIKLTNFIKKIKTYFNPKYAFTFDKNYVRDIDGNWLFKAYGSHTYVKKTWQQISSGNFLNSVNPKDIAFIAEAEAWFKLKSKRLSVSEETRKGTVTLVNGGERLKIKSCELLSAYETLERVSSVDVSMIAYREGFRKGRKVSFPLSEKENIKSRPKAALRIIK